MHSSAVPGLSSSNLAAVDWNPETEEMVITFHQGRQYTYQGVPEDVYQGLLDAGSPGKYFNQNIRGQYGESEG